MRAWVYIPTGETSANPAVTPATKVEVDYESLDALLDKLECEAPEGTRVVTFGPKVVHYVLGHRGFVRKLEVISA